MQRKEMIITIDKKGEDSIVARPKLKSHNFSRLSELLSSALAYQ